MALRGWIDSSVSYQKRGNKWEKLGENNKAILKIAVNVLKKDSTVELCFKTDS